MWIGYGLMHLLTSGNDDDNSHQHLVHQLVVGVAVLLHQIHVPDDVHRHVALQAVRNEDGYGEQNSDRLRHAVTRKGEIGSIFKAPSPLELVMG